MFEEFPRVKHEVESVAKKYKQFFEIETVQWDNPDDKATVYLVLNLRPAPGASLEAFYKNTNDYVKLLENLKLIENLNRNFKVRPTIMPASTKPELLYNNLPIDPKTIKLIYEFKSGEQDKKYKDGLSWVLYADNINDHSCVRAPMDAETLGKFLEFLSK